MSDYFQQYMEYTCTETECPHFYHRWGAIMSLSSFIGRDAFLEHGHFNISPNIYAMLIGEPGARKSTAIKIAKKIVLAAGYDVSKIAADKTSKEKFLFDMAAQNDHSLLDDGDPKKARNGVDILEQNLWGEEDYESKPPAEMFIAADEFNDFMGTGNIDFISLLGNLWDYSGVFKSRVKNGKSIAIPNPTVNLFGGNTQVNFAKCFPPETLGQGFFSRLLLVYGESTGVKIPFPRSPSVERTKELVEVLGRIKQSVSGRVELEHEAENLLSKIYQEYPPLEDPRFVGYSQRRFTHLLKLCIVCAAARSSRCITEADVILANTILAHTESMMPKALGEFGKSKHSDVAHTIMEILDKATAPVDFKHLWGAVHQDLEKPQLLQEIIAGLSMAKKIQHIKEGGSDGQGGFLPLRKRAVEFDESMVDWNLLSLEERGVI